MWTKLDDNFPDHEKVMEAGPLASWLYVCGLCYSNRLLTDGFIPSGQLRKLADVKNAEKLAQKLVEVGLWEITNGGYKVHDYHDHNLTSEDAKARRAEISQARSEAGKKGMEKRWGTSNKEDNKHNKTDNKAHRDMLSDPDNKTITPSRTRINNTKERESNTDIEVVNPTLAQRGVTDNFTEFADQFWKTYPARNGKRPKKKECVIELRRLGVAEWDDVITAAHNFALSGQAVRGFAPDAFRWLKDDWKQWLIPEEAHTEGTNGRPTISKRDAGFLDYFRAVRTEYEQGEGDSPAGGNRLYLPSGEPTTPNGRTDNGDGPQGLVPFPKRHPH